MSSSKFVINGNLPSLNDYVLGNRNNKYQGNTMKKKCERAISMYIKKSNIQRYDKKIKLVINWYEKDIRRDFDNIVFAKKFILDSMVKCGVIPNDNRKYINDIHDNVYVDRINPRIEVNIYDI